MERSSLSQRYEALQKFTVELVQAPPTSELLEQILNRAIDLLICDAGSLYLKKDENTLIFEVAENRSVSFDFQKKEVPATGNGIAAYVFHQGQSLIIDDAYRIPGEAPYQFDHSFDQKLNYRTASILTYPLVSSKGETLGVIQLINRKKKLSDRWEYQAGDMRKRFPKFNQEDLKLIESFGSIAAASLENAKLYQNIEDLFEGFAKASIQAIESRDEITSGHSERVAELTMDLAYKVNRADHGRELKAIHFSSEELLELRYAALLHDFGKIGVPEDILQKKEKLSPLQKTEISGRIDQFQLNAEKDLYKQLLQRLAEENRPPSELDWAWLERWIQIERDKFRRIWDDILTLNQPSILNESKEKTLSGLTELYFENKNGEKQPLLNEQDRNSLQISKGSLNEQERRAIESHVTHTYHFLKNIPWMDSLKNVPEIAYSHHEYLDGTGYPRQLSGDSIPIGTRLLTICDIFDALVARDRPYKKAVSKDRALDILNDEAQRGRIDQRFFEVFLEGKIYEVIDYDTRGRRQAA